jgi:hypothetical protein
MELTSAGAIALITYCAGSSSHKITSTRSPFNSFDTACTREPRIPIQKISEKLADQLGVDAEVAGVLIDEGFASVDDIADADAASLETVEEFELAKLLLLI